MAEGDRESGALQIPDDDWTNLRNSLVNADREGQDRYRSGGTASTRLFAAERSASLHE